MSPPKKTAFSSIFVKESNMLKCWSIEDLSVSFSLKYNRVSVGYEKLLFHDGSVKDAANTFIGSTSLLNPPALGPVDTQ